MSKLLNITKLSRKKMKAFIGMGAMLASLFVLTPAANASCERTVYNKSDNLLVIDLGRNFTVSNGKATSGRNDFPTSAELAVYAAKGQKLIATNHGGWTIIVYPNETRRIHYDDGYYNQNAKTSLDSNTLQIQAYSYPGLEEEYYKRFKMYAYKTNAAKEHGEMYRDILTFGQAKTSACGYIRHDDQSNTGRVTLNNPADGDMIFEPTPLGDNCVSLYTGLNGTGKKLSLCEPLHNWKDYTNLGGVGDQSTSHHHAVKSFQCGTGIDRLMFVNGNRDSVAPILQYCHGGIMSNVDAAVTKNGTGVGIYK